MRLEVMDIETDDLDAKHIWLICCKNVTTKKIVLFKNLTEDKHEAEKFKKYCEGVDKFIFHNGISFDVPVINSLLGFTIEPSKIIDTLVISRLYHYSILKGHSLDAWGRRLGLYKGKFTDFKSGLSDEMIEYGINDVEVTHRLFDNFKHIVFDDKWAKSLRLEHDIQIICQGMKENGFKFNEDQAEEYLGSVLVRMEELENQFQIDFPPKLTEMKRIKYKVRADGSLFKSVTDALLRYENTRIDGDDLVCLDYMDFNPGSTKQRIERLWEAGWKPVDKTKGHLLFEREEDKDPERGKKFEYYGWMCNETNLNTLPVNAPSGGLALAEWLTLEGRRSSLAEWLGCVKEDGRIHGSFNHIGAWTGRLSHAAPNQANIPSAFHGTPTTAVEKVKHTYDGAFRELWCVGEGNYLVGTDADGIQLRILADLMGSQEYVDAILSGKKEDETDIHNVNRKALGLSHITRDMAKTFIYAFLLGAGTAKVSQILKTDKRQATRAVSNFMESISGLSRLKKKIVPQIALAGMLQNGESTIMKHATRKWINWGRKEGIVFKLVTWPHDEWQTEVMGSKDSAERLGTIQRKSIESVGVELGLTCPLAGSTSIGKSWLDTH